MIHGNINNLPQRLKILVSPLDWGLGHATRCIPIIRILLQNNAEVLIAGEGNVVQILHKEFPDLRILPLTGYRITYSKSKNAFALKIISQLPSVLHSVKFENAWLRKIIEEEHIDAVISDNRPGLYSDKIPCIYITHQLYIKTGNNLINRFVSGIHHRYINRFSGCWVPDLKGAGNLAGALSHPDRMPSVPVKYLGILSRFQKKKTDKKYDLLFLLSGPEPQRTIFEQLIIKQLNTSGYSYNILRGLPDAETELSINKNGKVYNHLNANELSELIQSSKLVIARSGYSTIMDLVILQQHALLVPTPGQGEQEYLAEYLASNHLFSFVRQEDFDLSKLNFYTHPGNNLMDAAVNDTVISDWLNTIKKTDQKWN